MEEYQHQNLSSNPDRGFQVEKWNKVFSNRNRKKNDKAFSECLREKKVKRKPLDSFLQDTEFSVPSREVEEVRKFFENVPDKDTLQPQLAKAWVDYRRKSTDNQRVRPGWRTPTEVSTFLRERSVDPIEHLDVVRRTIYMPELTLGFIHAFAESASWNEVYALRAMVRRHIARRTVFQVHIPLTGFLTFRLELSLPLLVLREETTETNTVPPPPNSRAQLLPIDLSFLNLGSRVGGTSARFSIRRGHDTILIFGCDQFEWTGFAFSDYRPDSDRGQMEDDEGNEGDSGVDDSEDEEDDDDEEEMPDEDFFASSGYEEVLDAYHTIWDPRIYYLRTAAIRLGVVYHEYTYLVETLEAGVDNWIKENVYATPRSPPGQGLSNSYKLWDHDTTQIKRILHELHVNLSAIITVGERFSNHGGGIGYFSDITDQNAVHALQRIRGYFRQIKVLEMTLNRLDRLCEDAARHLTVQMSVEANAEAITFSRQTHSWNLRLSNKMRRFAEASSKAAEETSRTTRINVQLLFFTTPCAIALQYFCADRNFLSIDRTPKTFVLSLILLILVTYLVSIGVEFFNFIKNVLIKKTLARMGRKKHPRKDAAHTQEAGINDNDDDDNDDMVEDANMTSRV